MTRCSIARPERSLAFVNVANPELWIQAGALGLLALVLFALYQGTREVWKTAKTAITAGLKRFNDSADKFDRTVKELAEKHHAAEASASRRHHASIAATARLVRSTERHLVAEFRRELLEEARCPKCGAECLILKGEVLEACETCIEEGSDHG